MTSLCRHWTETSASLLLKEEEKDGWPGSRRHRVEMPARLLSKTMTPYSKQGQETLPQKRRRKKEEGENLRTSFCQHRTETSAGLFLKGEEKDGWPGSC